MGIHIRTCFCLIASSVLYTLCIFPVLLVLMPFVNRTFQDKIWRTTIVCYGIFTVYFSLKIWGKVKYIDMRSQERIPGIFIANHRSASDGFMASFLNRDFVQVASSWAFKIPFLGFFAKRGGYLNIAKLSFAEFLDKSCCLLKQNINIISFPEGTRSGSKKMGQFHSGIFKVALEAKCPIYPLCIVGSEKMPDRNFRMHDGKIKVFKLPAIAYGEYKHMSAFVLKKHIRNILQDKIMQEEGE